MSRRRVEGAALAAVLIVGGAVPIAQWTASAATKAPACTTWTDPEGDASTGMEPNPTGQTGDKNLDIVATTFATTTDAFTATVKVSAFNESASDTGDDVYVEFTAAGKSLRIFALRNGTGGFPNGNQVGLRNNTDSKTALGKAKVLYDTKASTIALTATLADLAEVAGAAVKGQKVTTLTTTTRDDALNQGGLLYDTSSTDQSPVLGTACGSGATAKPTATPTMAPKPTTNGGGQQASADPSKDFPKAGCTTLTDPKGDSTVRVVTTGPGLPNDPDTDLTSLTLRTTTTDLVAYIGVDKLAAGPSTTDGHRFTLDFTFNGHVFSAAGSASAHGSTAIRDGVAASGGVGHVVQLGVDVPSLTALPPSAERGFKASGLKVTFDLANSRVVMALPIADIEKYGAAKFTGKITAVDALAAVDSNTISTRADTTSKDDASPSVDTWTVNDNVCFAKK